MVRNLHACLVHESPECVLDLVRNLRRLDPASTILLYDGSPAAGLLRSTFPFERYGAVVHPSPRPMCWGRLHEFALESMRFALANLPFDALTIVDSDQLASRSGYSDRLDQALAAHPKAGVFSNVTAVLPPGSRVGPAPAAFQELDLWLPFLRRFPRGEEKFPHWSFWPSTVFTAAAARDLTHLIDTDPLLPDLLQRSRIWATEEIVLPSLAVLLGYEVAPKPTSGDFVRYREVYSSSDIEQALQRPDVYWIHPVPRRYDDPVRSRIREQFSSYDCAASECAAPTDAPEDSLTLLFPILERMRRIEGWLDEEEGELLAAALGRALDLLPAGFPIVEAGCFCGRATVVLAGVLQMRRARNPIYSIDPHDGRAGALDRGLQNFGPTFNRFRRNLELHGAADRVDAIEAPPADVSWTRPIGFLLVDGLHDYPSVARDFHHFEPWILPGGYVAFHDYADYFPGVRSFVNELLDGNGYRKIARAGSLMVLRKNAACAVANLPAGPAILAASPSPRPMVSCIMPTADRRTFLPQAIRHFLKQDYPGRELIIVDDGSDSVADLIPEHETIRYVRLPERISMGAKHNLACHMARGEMIVHLDDDDWNAAWRLSYQVESLLQHPEKGICGLSRVLFYEPTAQQAWEYLYPSNGRPWVYGATFCYRRAFWERHRFPDMNEGADTTYIWNLDGSQVLPLENHRFFVATVHPGNTSPKRTHTCGWQPRPSSDILSFLDDDGLSFYKLLRSSANPVDK